MAVHALGAFHAGDILVNDFLPRAIRQYAPDGTLLQTFTDGGRTSSWMGVSLTPDGNVVTTYRYVNGQSAPGVHVFDAAGTLNRSFGTPQITQLQGDISVFADGTIAVSDQGKPPFNGAVHLYTPDGVFLRSLSLLGFPFASSVTPDDSLWVGSGRIQRITKAGVLETVVPTTHWGLGVSELLVDFAVDADGSVWETIGRGTVHHLRPDGTVLGSFQTSHRSPFVALADDGTLYLTDLNNPTNLYHYSRTGAILNTLRLADGARPLFLTVVSGIPEPGLATFGGLGVVLVTLRTRSSRRKTKTADGNLPAGRSR